MPISAVTNNISQVLKKFITKYSQQINRGTPMFLQPLDISEMNYGKNFDARPDLAKTFAAGGGDATLKGPQKDHFRIFADANAMVCLPICNLL